MNMNEEPKSIWKKSWNLPGLLLAWLILMVATMAIFELILFISNDSSNVAGRLVFGAITATLFLGLWLFVRWLCCWKNFRRFLFGLACSATLVALFYAEEDWRGWHAWNQFKQQWEAKGEHFELASIVPPPVPDDQNFAMTPIAFSSYGQILTRAGKPIPSAQRDTNFVVRMHMDISDNFNDPTNGGGDRVQGKLTRLEAWQNYYRELASKTNEFPVPAQRGSPAADVLVALGRYEAVIEELRAASRLPASRFPLTYDSESPAAILLPHLAPLKCCARVLSLRSVAELQNSQSEQALADVRLGLQLTDKIRSEPVLISHLVRLSMVQLMLQPVWEGLAQQKWPDAQLAALEAELSKFDFPADYQRSMRGEIALQNGEIEHLRRHPEELENVQAFSFDDTRGNASFLPGGPFGHLIPTGWFYQNQYRCARTMMDYYFPVADLARGTFSPDVARRGDAAVAAEVKSPSPFNLLERMFMPALGNAARHFAFGQASIALARTAIALERYRLARGEFPDALDPLAPQFIAQVPSDVVGGQPLKYRRNPDGRFVLYSIGWNGTDDGGVQVFEKGSSPKVDQAQGDWVWQYPEK